MIQPISEALTQRTGIIKQGSLSCSIIASIWQEAAQAVFRVTVLPAGATYRSRSRSGCPS